MPTIDVEMARSLRGGLLEIMKENFARSVAETLRRRDIIGDTEQHVDNVKTAFSSWDNCMKAAYCKWPVIAIIVVGSLILLSIITCVVRCCCCGMSCCCSCFRCLKCCECCTCCEPPRKNNQYLDAPYVPPHHGYQQQPPMHANYGPPPPQHHSSVPQYAEFETGRKGPEDALPQMPGWDTANSKKVLIEEDDAVEMNALKPKTNEHPNDPRMAGASAAGAVSPVSIHEQRHGYNRTPQGEMNQYNAVGAGNRMHDNRTVSPFAPNDRQGPFGQPGQGYGSNRLSDGYGLDQPYDNHAAALPAPTIPLVAAGTLLGQQQHDASHQYNQGYAEMPIEPGQAQATPHSGYSEMPSEPRAVGAELPGSVSAQSFEMSAEPLGYGQKSHQSPNEPIIMEMPTSDHVAPVELDGGMAPITPATATPTAARGNSQSPPNPQMQRRPTGDNVPDGYGMRHQGTGESNAGQYGNRPPPQGNPGRPDAMRRQGTGDSSNPGGAPYGMDPRMRNSPGPRSPGGMSPGPRNSPGPGQRRGPGPGPGGRPDQYQPSPLNTPGPYGDGYSRPPPRDGGNRTYSPAPQMRSPQHTVPLAQPTPRGPDIAPPPTSPITNNAGFDFSSGYSRPPAGNRVNSEQSLNGGRNPQPGYQQQQQQQQYGQHQGW